MGWVHMCVVGCFFFYSFGVRARTHMSNQHILHGDATLCDNHHWVNAKRQLAWSNHVVEESIN